jgi:phage tail protein X
VSHAEAPISITVKTPAGSLVTVRAENGEQLDALVSEAYAAIASAVTELESNIRGTVSAPPAMTASQVASALGGSIVSNDDAGWQSAPVTAGIGGKACPHGKMTAIQGTGKDGNIYRGYFCAAPKGALDKCKNVYVRMGTAEWNTFTPDQVK